MSFRWNLLLREILMENQNIFRFNTNFAIYGIMDILHDTTGKFDESENGRRHRTLFSFKPARKIFDKIHNVTGKYK